MSVKRYDIEAWSECMDESCRFGTCDHEMESGEYHRHAECEADRERERAAFERTIRDGDREIDILRGRIAELEAALGNLRTRDEDISGENCWCPNPHMRTGHSDVCKQARAALAKGEHNDT